jgi:16S rRNA C967 or C1407 C5-methylase (RsmB/RsmF family)
MEELLSETTDLTVSRPSVPDEYVSNAGFLRTSPEKHGMDGFFAAILDRT